MLKTKMADTGGIPDTATKQESKCNENITETAEKNNGFDALLCSGGQI